LQATDGGRNQSSKPRCTECGLCAPCSVLSLRKADTADPRIHDDPQLCPQKVFLFVSDGTSAFPCPRIGLGELTRDRRRVTVSGSFISYRPFFHYRVSACRPTSTETAREYVTHPSGDPNVILGQSCGYQSFVSSSSTCNNE